VAVGDVNGDTKLDLIFSARGPGFASQGGEVLWSFGNGTGGFVDGGLMSVNDSGVGIAAGDFTNDGKLDILVYSSGGSACSAEPHCLAALQSLIGDGTGNFVKNTFGNLANYNLLTGDFNNDGKLDIFSSAGITLGDGLGGFSLSTPLPGSGDTDPGSGGITAVGDLNHDGNLDGLQIMNHPGGQVALFFGNGAGGLSDVHYFTPGATPSGLATADFNHNGQIDLAVSLRTQNKVVIYYDGVVEGLENTHVFDFDGDARTDIAVYRPGSPGMWYIIRSTDNTFQQFAFGATGDIPVAADYNGNSTVDMAVYRPSEGRWYISNYPAAGYSTADYGINTDLPIPGADYNGDGRADLTLYRMSGGMGTFYLTNGGNFGSTVQLGVTGNQPVVGDFDGDGKSDVAVYRKGAAPTDQSYWLILRSSDHVLSTVAFGIGEDKPVPADFEGDHTTNIAVFRPSTGYWYTTQNPATNYGARQWGQSGDIPLTGDYDGDGKIDLSVYRGGVWYLLNSSNNSLASYYFGVASDKPVPSMSLP
jgi:hypothetical protein